MADPASISSGGSAVSHSGFVTILGGWLLSSEAAVLIGIAMSVGGFVVSTYYKRRQRIEESRVAAEQSRQIAARAQQDAEYHAARMAALQAGRVADES